MKFVTYVIKSLSDGKYYVGSCENVDKRLKQHNTGKTRSTKSGAPWKLVHQELYDTRQEAYKRERKIKSYKGGEVFKKLLQ